MKKILFMYLLFAFLFLLGCSSDLVNQTEIKLDLDIYEFVTEENRVTFEYSKTVSIDSTFEIVSIEKLTTKFAEFPYESVFIEEKDLPKYIKAVDAFINQISSDNIEASFPYFLGHKAAIIISLTDGNSDLVISFYFNSTNEISSSSISYSNYEDIDFIHYFISDDNISYTEINKML